MKLLCWLLGHKWQKLGAITVGDDSTSKGSAGLEHCSRCNDVKFYCDASLKLEPIKVYECNDEMCKCEKKPKSKTKRKLETKPEKVSIRILRDKGQMP